ncbi:hypothetical protein HDU87_004320 [Geranomyces variabilis]|uniref:Activator of Hsp90 ATPase AHSA1-like N-terminal domain-containing protein n=1 Tax=Geranomyces variabilis TaxID=109894 RepID=A0AAD5XS42_9FUNG|nr:hypothetical protein HDU87_004320 [Geranomyces variabilis]
MTTGTGTNWKNVNNWHWISKDCLPWSKEYFTQALTGAEATKDGVTVSVEEVKDVTGDVDINQRKGKIITIFDVVIDLAWKGEGYGTTASGKIHIPEYMHDTELKDIVFDISVDSPNADREKIKDIVRLELTKVLRERMAPFAKALVDAHLKDVYIAPEAMQGHPVLKSYAPKPPAPATTSSTTAAESAGKSGVTTIKQTIEFSASPRDIFETLVDKQRVQGWTRGKAEVGREVGSKFCLFDGNITGEVVEVVENKKLVQKWRLKSWPAGHFSTVEFEFSEKAGTTLKVTQSDVPIAEKDSTEKNWQTYYWNSIRATFGYVAAESIQF